jgi:hypothetical protein
MARMLIFIVAGWSGFFVMGVEMLSGRLLAPYFGNSVYVWGGIITIFMLALSIGYLVGGKLSLHDPTLKKLAGILLCSALTSLPIVTVGEWTLDQVSILIDDPRYGALTGALLLFSIPTFFCGMISPYTIRLLVSEHLLSGQFAGRLYFVSTIGSALGTLLTSFYFVLYWEIDHIIWGLLLVSVLIAIPVSLWRIKHVSH